MKTLTQTTIPTNPAQLKTYIITILLSLLIISGVAIINKELGTNIQVTQVNQEEIALAQQLNESVQQIQGQLSTNLDAVFYTLQKPCAYIIGVCNPSSPIYTMQNGTTGALDYYSTNASQAIDFAFANLTANGNNGIQTVYAFGNITIANTLLIWPFTNFVFNTINEAPGSNCVMIQNANYSDCRDTTINGGILNMNNNAANCTFFNSTYGPPMLNFPVYVENIHFENVEGYCIVMYSIDCENVLSCYGVTGNIYGGTLFYSTTDGVEQGCDWAANGPSIAYAAIWSNAGPNMYTGNYVSGGWTGLLLYGADNTNIVGLNIDSVSYDGILMENNQYGGGCQNDTLTGIVIHNPAKSAGGNGTASAIELSGLCFGDNLINANLCADSYNNPSSYYPKYGIYDHITVAANSGNDTIGWCDSNNAWTAQIYCVPALTVEAIHSCMNGTVWVT
jgi:hypothetical protein